MAAIGWTFAILLLCIDIIVVTIWIRRHASMKRKLSLTPQEDMKDNSAYNIIPLHHKAGIQRHDAVEYEEIRAVGKDPDHHQYEKPETE
jgi:hypothetical protein